MVCFTSYNYLAPLTSPMVETCCVTPFYIKRSCLEFPYGLLVYKTTNVKSGIFFSNKLEIFTYFVNTGVSKSQLNDKFTLKRPNSQENIYCKDMFIAVRFKELLISQYY